jgi:hypothetical protein
VNTTALATICAICAEAPAEVVDIEHGPLCFTCHDDLQTADRATTFLISPQPTNQTHDLQP